MIAETYVTVHAERSRYFGPDGSYQQRGNGSTRNNLNSDFFFQRIIDDRGIERLLDAAAAERARSRRSAGRARLRRGLQPLPARHRGDERARPALPRQGVGAADHRDGRLPALLPARAAGQLGRSRSTASAARSRRRRPALGPARRSTPTRAARDARRPAAARRPRLQRRRRSAARRPTTAGLLLGNPHFPWHGPERFYQAHLTIPGQGRRGGRLAVRRAARPHRPHREPGLEPHRLDRVPLHAVPAEARARARRRRTSYDGQPRR